jgi:hypothetical protein
MKGQKYKIIMDIEGDDGSKVQAGRQLKKA